VTLREPITVLDDGAAQEPPAPPVDVRPVALLRGSATGLEIVVDGNAASDAIADAVARRLAEAPSFFRGCDARVRVEDRPLEPGSLAKLDAIASRFALRIVEVSAPRPRGTDAVPEPTPATGSTPEPAGPEAVASPMPADQAVSPSPPETEPAPEPPPPVPAAVEAPTVDFHGSETPTRLIVGPIRSGVVLEHVGHLVVFGDVNPGAEIRAQGNIVVLGRLRGTAHAGIGRTVGFILALRLEPQQLRIGRQIARASEGDAAAAHPEIAHVTGANIIVERYQGRLPSALSISI